MTHMTINLRSDHHAFISCIAAVNQQHTDPAVLRSV